MLLIEGQWVDTLWLPWGKWDMYEADIEEMEHYGHYPIAKYYDSGITTTTLSPWIDSEYQIPDPLTLSPDFRVPEQLPTPKPLGRYTSSYKQYNRPYRFSSSAYIAYHYGQSRGGSHFFKPVSSKVRGVQASQGTLGSSKNSKIKIQNNLLQQT